MHFTQKLLCCFNLPLSAERCLDKFFISSDFSQTNRKICKSLPKIPIRSKRGGRQSRAYSQSPLPSPSCNYQLFMPLFFSFEAGPNTLSQAERLLSAREPVRCNPDSHRRKRPAGRPSGRCRQGSPGIYWQ